jgi:hypothetical protein
MDLTRKNCEEVTQLFQQKGNRRLAYRPANPIIRREEAMKKIVLCTCLVSLIVLGSSLAWAGSGSGTITNFAPGKDGIVTIYLSNMTGKISCNLQSRFAVNTNFAGGRSIYAAALAFYLAGKQVSVVGDGTCSYESENISYMINAN